MEYTIGGQQYADNMQRKLMKQINIHQCIDLPHSFYAFPAKQFCQ